MAQKHKMTRREIRHDEVKDFTEHTQDWFRKHSASIGTVLTTCLVIFAVYMVYTRWNDNRLAKGSSEYAELMTAYYEALNTPEESLKEKCNTTVLAADKIIETYGNMAIARNARILKGNMRYYEALALDPAKIDNVTSASEFIARREEAFKAARETFDGALSTAITPTEKAEARLALAQTIESMAFLNSDKTLVADAIGHYKTILDLVPATWLSAEAALGLGRMMQAQEGKEKEASALYASVAKDRALPAVVEEAGARAPKDSKGADVSMETVHELKQRTKLSYQAIAQKLESAVSTEVK